MAKTEERGMLDTCSRSSPINGPKGGGVKRLTQIESPLQVVNTGLRELRDDESTHPVRRSRSGSTANAPADGVDLGVVDPRDLCETRSVEEVVEEEHGRHDASELYMC